ncbi:MAG: hypothetical protein OXT67_12695, partial [Zetaproteobacteria bacterium]|nr:hypothetical protein [Zetaproteobacteria bacterium]
MILCKEKYVSLCLKVLGLLGTVVLTFTLHANPAVPQLRYAEQLLKQAGLGYDRWCALHHESLQAHFACKPYEQQYQQIKDTVNIVTQEYRALQQRVRELETAAAEIQAQLDRGDGENPQALREQLQEIEAQCASQREELRAIAAAQDERVQQALQISREHIKPLRREMDEAFPRVDAAEATFQQQYDEALGAYLEGLDLLGPSHARLRDNGRRQLSYIVDSKTLLQIEYSWPERLIKLEGLFARTVQQASATPRVASSSRLVRSVAPPRRSLGDLHFETFCQQSLEE